MADVYLTFKPRKQNISHVWRTSVQKNIKGDEKRSALYTWPRVRLNGIYDLVGSTDVNWLKRNLLRYVDALWGIPLWIDRTLLTAEAASGQKIISVAETDYRHFYVGRECVIINPSDFTSYEVGTISALTSTQITVESNLTSTWALGSVILPLYEFRIKNIQEVLGLVQFYQEFELRAEEAFESVRSFSYTLPSSGADTYKNLDLFLQRYPKPSLFEFNREYDLFQSLGMGYVVSRNDSDDNVLLMKNKLVRTSRSDIWDTLKFFDSKQGRQIPFWAPSRVRDIIVTQAVLSTDTVLNIEDIEYSTYYLTNDVIGRYIYIQFPDDTYVCKKIVDATSTTITLDSQIGTAVSADDIAWLMVSFLNLARFNIDELSLNYIIEGVALIDVSFKTLFSYGLQSNGSVVIEGCSSLTGWTDNDNGTNAESSQVTFQGEEGFKFDSGDQASGNKASRSKDLGVLGSRIIVTISLYLSALGTRANTDCFQLIVQKSDLRFEVVWGTDGVFIYDGASYNAVTLSFNIGQWHEWTFDIDASTPASATCDVYLDGELEEEGVDCSDETAGTDGTVDLTQFGYNTANRLSYVNAIRLGDDLELI